MAYEGAKEFLSAQTASYPGLVGLEMGATSYNWAVTAGQRSRELKRLTSINHEAGNQIRTLVDALERIGYSPDLFVSKQGSVSMRLAGRTIHLPVYDQLRGVVTMGASEYAGAMQATWTGSQMERLNVMQAFIERVRAHIPGEGVRIKGIDAVHDKSKLPGIIQELTRQVREEWLQSIHTASGGTQFSRAYFMRNRIQADITNLPELQNLAEEIRKIQGHLATRRGRAYGNVPWGPELERLLQEKTEAFRVQLMEAFPEGHFAGLKPAAFMPHIKRMKKSGGQVRDRVILSMLPGDALSSLDVANELHKGRYQMVLARLLHRSDLPSDPVSAGVSRVAGDAMGRRRIVPILTEKGYFDQLDQYAAMRAHKLGRKLQPDDLLDLTTRMPMTLGLIDPGQSSFAYRWLRSYVDDTGVLLGTKLARQVAGAGERHYSVKVNVNRFLSSRDLSAYLTDLEYIEHRQLGEGLRAPDIGAVLRDNTVVDPAVMDRYAKQGRRVFGVSVDPFGRHLHTMDVEDIIESVQRKGDELTFRIRRGRASAGMGAGLLVDTRRIGVTGHLEALGRLGVDVAGGLGEFGIKFGKDAGLTHRLYAGHVFSRLERAGLRQSRYEALMERVAGAMGVDFEWRGDAKMGRRQFQAWITSENAGKVANWQGLVRDAAGGRSRHRLSRHEVVRAALDDPRITLEEKRKVVEAFKIPRTSFADILRASGEAVDDATARRMSRQGAYMLHLEGAPVTARDIDMPDKFSMNWRLTEHNLWRARGAGLDRQDARLAKAFSVLDDFLAPRIVESGVASDTLRFLGQFSQGMEGLSPHLMDAAQYTPDDIARMAMIPEAAGGKILAEQLVGQETLISTMGAKGDQLAYRRGGFYFSLREGDKVSIGITSSRGGRPMAKTASRFFIPGMEMFGRYGTNPEIWMEGGSRVVDGTVQRRLFGDYMNVLRSLEEYSRGSGSLKALQQRLNVLYQGMSEGLVGKHSLLKRYFIPDKTKGLTARTITHPALNRPGEMLTIGMTEEALRDMDPKMRARFKQGNAFGIITHYPTSDTAHQSIVRVKVMKRAEMLSGLSSEALDEISRHDMHKVVASSPALRLMSQRDLDFDWSYVRFIDDTEAMKAAETLYQQDLKRFGPVYELLNTLPEKAEEDFGLAFKRFQWDPLKAQMDQRSAMMEELSAIVRQQGKTPLAYNSFVKQRQIATWLGHGATREMVMDAVGGAETRAGRSIEKIGSLLGDPRHREMMGEVWTATINSMLKKDSEKGFITELVTNLRANAKMAVTSKDHRGQLAQEFFELFVDNSATQGVLAEMGLARGQTGISGTDAAARIMGQFPDRYQAAMDRYFHPLAEFMGHMQVVEEAVQDTHLKHALISMTGTVGEYERMADLEGVMTQLAALKGTTAPRLAAHADPQAALDVLADTDHMRVRDAVEGLVDEGPSEQIARQAKNLAADGLTMVQELWRKPWGKVGIIAGGAVLANELFGGLFRGDPEPVYPGGGAPMPPRPAMAGIAGQQHVNQNMLPPAQARIHSPYHMRTHAQAQAYAPTRPMPIASGYVSPLPSDSEFVYAEGYQPDATRWGMQNYMSRQMASSF